MKLELLCLWIASNYIGLAVDWAEDNTIGPVYFALISMVSAIFLFVLTILEAWRGE